MNKRVIIFVSCILLCCEIIHAQWSLNGDNLQAMGTNKILTGILPGSFPGKVNIAALSTEPNIWLYGGPSFSSSNLSSRFNINIGAGASLGMITNSNSGSGGLGILNGPNLSSPIVWMYNSTTGNNAFTVARVNYDPAGFSTIENNLTSLFQVRENGNVGISTNSPLARLDVGADISNAALGTVFGRLPEGNSSGEGTFLGVRGYGTQSTSYSGKSFALEHSFYGQINSSVNFFRGGGITGGFITFNTNTNQEQMRITTGGSVGIGTTNPGSFKLAVEGKIGAREVNVTTASWSDYVFDDMYQLRPLEEVRQYINENKHLPEIPSEKEVIANGQNLGEMNMLLLKKVEELTLYMIEQQKQIEELKTLIKK